MTTVDTVQKELIEKGWAALPAAYRTPDHAPTPEFREFMRYEVDYARRMFEKGLPLIQMVDGELAIDLDLFSRGGLEILDAIEQQDYDVPRARPPISKTRKVALLLRALSGRFLGRSAA